MIIDFKEIPQANLGDGRQDTFELFARDFLLEIGFRIESEPSRGADGKKDFIVSDIRQGVEQNTIVRWLVSCKHYAHSKKSVSDNEENNIIDRLKRHKCDGFIGFYSTIASSGLAGMLEGLKDEISISIFDYRKIERIILGLGAPSTLFARYFPESFQKHRENIQGARHEDHNKYNSPSQITEEIIFQAAKTAGIIIEIIKIRDSYFNGEWRAKENALDELHKFANHSNFRITESVYSFLLEIAENTRAGGPDGIYSSVYSLVIDFAPFYEHSSKQAMELFKIAANIGQNIVYDALIKLNSLSIATNGLLVLQYINRYARDKRDIDLETIVSNTFDEISGFVKGRDYQSKLDAEVLFDCFERALQRKEMGIPSDLPASIYSLIR